MGSRLLPFLRHFDRVDTGGDCRGISNPRANTAEACEEAGVELSLEAPVARVLVG